MSSSEQKPGASSPSTAVPFVGETTSPGETPSVGQTLDRRVGADAAEIALVKRGDTWEIVFDGQFLMSSECRRSERELATLSLAPMGQRDDISVLVAGLGMGHTLRAVLDVPGVVRVDVVEISEAVVEWNRQHFAALNGNALADPRVHLHTADLLGFFKRLRYEPIEAVQGGWLAVLLDVDNGPTWLSRPQNQSIYTEEGLARLEAALRHGGVLGIWSAQRELDLFRAMHARFVNVAELAVPVEVNGRASLDYVYRGRRAPERKSGGGRMAQA